MSYPPIYIINLKRTPERKLYIQRELDALKLEYQFVEAIDSYKLNSGKYRKAIASQIDVDAYEIKSMCEIMDEGRTACALSHIKIYDLMMKNNIPVACVLEDDCCLLPSFREILSTSHEVSWDVLMLSHQSRFIRKILELLYFDTRTKIIFHHLPRLILYKISYPELNLYTVRMMFANVVKHTLKRYRNLMRRTNTKVKDNTRRAHTLSKCLYEENSMDKMKKKFLEYCACKLGAAPTPKKSSWHKSVAGHYIAKPIVVKGNRPTSSMAYILTQSAAAEWKKAIVSKLQKNDIVIGHLYHKENLNLRIVVPPCVVAQYDYLFYSTSRIE